MSFLSRLFKSDSREHSYNSRVSFLNPNSTLGEIDLYLIGEGRHEGQVDVDVRIDKSREDQLAGSIDYLRAGRRFQIRPDASNGVAFGKDVRAESRISIHNVGVAD